MMTAARPMTMAPGHIHGGAALILGQQGARQGHQALDTTRPSTLHQLVLMPWARAMAWLEPVARREEPSSVPKTSRAGDDHHGEDGQQEQRVGQIQLPDVPGGDQQVLLVHAQGQGGLGFGAFSPDGHNAQVDGVEGQLGQDPGQDGRDAAGGVEKTGDQAGSMPAMRAISRASQGFQPS